MLTIGATETQFFHRTAAADSGEAQLHASKHFNLDGALAACLAIAEGLSRVHAGMAMHQAVCPANIRLSEDGTAELRNDVMVPLAYVSPEQTGRMNRGIDYRSDFYSMGVVFYEIFTGQLPFPNGDAMEMVHSHIARQASSPVKINPAVPAAIGNIVMKLLAKNAEDRYQSLDGLRADLQICQTALLSGDAVPEFQLGGQDVCDRLQLPQKLIGRETEMAQLLNAFERAAAGVAELLLVSGYSGIGKSSLVNEIQKPVTARGGYFIAGKFDQFKRNIPYYAVAQAFRELIRQILTESESRIQEWKSKFLTALGPNGQLMIDAIPELALIIGRQPGVVRLGATESQNRFHYVVRNFVSVLTQPEHPLALFLDDMQWADEASLKLIELFMTELDRPALLIVGAYRDHEVDSTGPLLLTIGAIRNRAAGDVTVIDIMPFSEETVCVLMADTFKAAPANVEQLAQLVYRKTLGNPFFVGKFIQNLCQEKLLQFRDGHWHWKIDEIAALQITDNVVDLLTKELARLPLQTRRLLRFAACIGSRFDYGLLAMLAEKSPEETMLLLQPALQAGLLMAPGQAFAPEAGASRIYSFRHDRVQQAAYAEMSDQESRAMHLRIGRLLIASVTEAQHDAHLFDIVQHMNAGSELIEKTQEKIELAWLNLQAAARARSAVAYETVWNHASIGVALLAGIDEQRSPLYFSLQLEQLEGGFMSHRFQEVGRIGEEMLLYANDDEQRARVYDILIHSLLYQDRHAEGRALALQALRMLKINLPENVGKPTLVFRLWQVKILLGRFTNDQLLNFPRETGAIELLKQLILSRAVSASYVASPAQFPILTFKQIDIALKNGRFSPGLPWALGGYAMVLIQGFGAIPLASRLGKLMLDLTQKNQSGSQKDSHGVRVAFLAHAAIFHWTRHLLETPAPLYENYQDGLEVGEFEYACYSLVSALRAELLLGRPLEEMIVKLQAALVKTVQLKQKTSSDAIGIFFRYATALRHLPAKAIIDVDAHADGSTTRLTLMHVNLFEAMRAYAFDEFEVALARVRISEQYLASAACMPSVPACIFYHAICLLACHDGMTDNLRRIALGKVIQLQRKMKLWARHAPMNYLHKWQLVEAERKRLQGKNREASELYDLAIQGAREHGYGNDAALANELAGKFHIAMGKMLYGRMYISEAHAGYQKWGALAKLAKLEKDYPELLSGVILQRQARAAATLAPAEARLDIETVIKASNTLSGEIQLGQLLEKLMQLLIENAGAQRGTLLLQMEGVLHVQASIEADVIEVQQATPVNEQSNLSLSVINYVKRTRDKVVLGDAGNNSQFNGDPYMARARPKSLLCIPLQKQSELVGILYLENNLAVDAFTPERTELLQILSTQIAISLENATLYHDLERKIVERTRDLSIAKEAAEAANRAKSEFLAIMSHEIRTPMNGMLGMMQLAQDEAINPSQKEYIETAQYSAEALLTILNDILDFSKLESGNLEFESISFDLGKTVHSVINLMSARAREKGLALQLDYPDDLPRFVCGDVGRLRQVLLNLIGNALKFTEHGSISLRIRQLPDPAGQLRFMVSDTGIGIAQAAQSRLFQSFSQADNSITRRFGGTGLGLSICKKIVDMQGGRMGVDSTEGVGSQFWFDLAFPPALAAEEDAAPRQPDPAQARSLDILLAEDNEINQKVAISLLQKAGHRVHVAQDGREAVEAMRHQVFDLILMDMHMPGMDGLEATRLIRGMQGAACRVPIVALTAAGAVDDIQTCLDAGMNYFLGKPIRIERLRTILQELSAPSGLS